MVANGRNPKVTMAWKHRILFLSHLKVFRDHLGLLQQLHNHQRPRLLQFVLPPYSACDFQLMLQDGCSYCSPHIHNRARRKEKRMKRGIPFPFKDTALSFHTLPIYVPLTMSHVTWSTPVCPRQAGPHKPPKTKGTVVLCIGQGTTGVRFDWFIHLFIYSFKTQLLVIWSVSGFVLDSRHRKDNMTHK